MKILVLLILLAGVFPGAAALDLDGIWRFRTDPYGKGTAEGWWRKEYDTGSWDGMKVPGNWDVTPAYSNYTGDAWFSTRFILEKKPGKIYRLCFEGVATETEVWLNGIFLGSHDFAFTRFGFDITDLVEPGQGNVLTLKVNNRFKVGACWNYGGIRRPVAIWELPARGIEGVAVRTSTDSRNRRAALTAEVCLRRDSGNSVNRSHSDKVELSVSDSRGNRVASRKIASDADTVTANIRMENVGLWSFEHPELYELKVVWSGDTVRERFGLREIGIDGERFLLNGEAVKLCGANWVPDDPFYGNTLPASVYRRDIDLMKEAGVNMARLSHQGLPEEVLDYIDGKGILIMEEIPLWNKNEMVDGRHPVPLRWLGELTAQRRNHPCIIGWSVGNEIGRFSDNPGLEAYLERALGFIRKVDPDRLAVYVTHTAAKQPGEPAHLSDIILFNQYGAHGERADRVHEYNPGKPVFYSEYGRSVNRPDLDATVDYRSMLDDMGGREYIAGASVWSFNDYRTNYRDNLTDASGNRPWGAVDVYRRKKRAYGMLRHANSPLGRFECSVDSGKIHALVKPRGKGDIPSYIMKEYYVEASVYNGATKLSVQKCSLPEMRPGDDSTKVAFDSLSAYGADRVEVSLIAPAGYEVDKDTEYLRAPRVPEIDCVEAGDNRARIHFRKDESACEWAAEISVDGTVTRTPPTIEGYIEFGLPDFNKRYGVSLIALNGKGEARSEEVVIRPEAAILPPVIIHSGICGNELHVGFTTDFHDFYYEVEYGEAGCEPKKVSVGATGACVLPIGHPDKEHHVRVNRHLAYGYASPMSRTVSVKPRL